MSRPDFYTIYLEEPDTAGHRYGPESPEVSYSLNLHLSHWKIDEADVEVTTTVQVTAIETGRLSSRRF